MNRFHSCTARAVSAVLLLAVLIPVNSAFAEKDKPADAAVLAPTGTASGTMTELSSGVFDTYDWYTITTTGEGTLRLIAVSSGGLDLQLYMYHNVADMQNPNSGGSYIGGGGSATLDTVANKLRPCTVYIQAIRRSGAGGYSLSSVFTPAALTPDTEINDTPVVALTLAPAATATGRMGYYSYAMGTDAYDWYRVAIPADGKFTIRSTTSDGDLDLQLYIYRSVSDMRNVNPGGDYVGGGGDAENDTVTNLLRATNVYIQVIRRAGAGSYTLQTLFTLAALGDDGENNDTPAVARTVAPDSTTFGHMGYYSSEKGADSYDWYRITTPVDGRLTLFSQTTDGNLDLQLYIYRIVSDMHNVNPGGSYVGGGGTQVLDTATDLLDPRTVYVQVIRRSGTGSYTLRSVFAPALLANDQEPNDLPASSRTIPLDSSRTGHLGYFKSDLSIDTYDWYTVTVSTAQTLKFVSRVYEGDLNLQLYIYTTVSDMNSGNPGGTYFGGGGTAADDTASTAVSPGTYYLQVIRRGGTGSYVLACGSAVLSGTFRRPAMMKQTAAVALGSYPNPARTLTTLRYSVQAQGRVTLSVFDARGKLIAMPVNGIAPRGAFQCPFDVSRLPAGHYILRLAADGKAEQSIMRVVR